MKYVSFDSYIIWVKRAEPSRSELNKFNKIQLLNILFVNLTSGASINSKQWGNIDVDGFINEKKKKIS